MKRLYIFIFVMVVSSIFTTMKSQNIESMLNACAEVFNNRNVGLYDEVEKYLNEVNQDSIKNDLYLDILYHGNLAFLYSIRYEDWTKSAEEMDYLMTRITPVKHMPEFCVPYRHLLYAYGSNLMNSGQLEKSITYFNKLLIEDFDNEFDILKYDAYHALASIYDQLGNHTLSIDCHNHCQEFLVNYYVHLHPEHSFYKDNYQTLKYAISQLEKKNNTKTEDYINNLCSLGYLLHKIDQGEYMESLLIFSKARQCAIDNNLLKSRGLEECYVSLQDIFVKYIPEPEKSELIEKLIPCMVDFYSGTLEVEDIYESIGASFGANQQYEKALEFDLKALNLLETETNYNTEKIKRVYQSLVIDYLGLSTDNANQAAFDYLQRIKKIVSPKDGEYYDWYLDNYGTVLRYLYKTDEAIQFFKNNLSYYNKRYGKHSDQYISTLNQLALCHPFDSDNFISYLQDARSLTNNSNEVSKSTIRGVCVNLARYYIQKGRISEAISELRTAESIEKEIFGRVFPVTQDLINTCLAK